MPLADHRPRSRNVYRFEIEATWDGLPLEPQRLADMRVMLSALLVEGLGFSTARADHSQLLATTKAAPP